MVLFFRRPMLSGGSLRVVLAALGFLLGSTAWAADSGISKSSKLKIHGFASQAWAKSWIEDSPTSLLFTYQSDLVFGIPEDGTADYRTLALQFRYDLDEKSSIIVQFDYENAGDDLVTRGEGLGLDWAFYSHRFSNGYGVKVGRIPTPIGLFNETRDVGVLLPFYRPVGTFYGEGNLHSSTVDGLLVSKTFDAARGWSLSAEAYFGGWDIPEVFNEPTEGLQVRVAKARDVLGVQFWLENPDSTLRFGLGGNVYDGIGGVFRQRFGKSEHESWHASLEASYGGFIGRAEYRYRTFGPQTSPRASFDSEFENLYVQAGYRFGEHWSLWFQWDSAVLETFVLPPERLSKPSIQDPYEAAGPALAVNYAFNPNLVLKAEYHHAERALTTSIRPTAPGVFELNAETFDTRFAIVSLSYAF